jgi:hypothetical protein
MPQVGQTMSKRSGRKTYPATERYSGRTPAFADVLILRCPFTIFAACCPASTHYPVDDRRL